MWRETAGSVISKQYARQQAHEPDAAIAAHCEWDATEVTWRMSEARGQAAARVMRDQLASPGGSMLDQLWHDHSNSKFPTGYGGEEIEGIDLVLLDSTVAGCISSFLKNDRQLDLGRTAILGLCYREISIVLRTLKGEAEEYFTRLESMSKLVLQAIIRDNKQ